MGQQAAPSLASGSQIAGGASATASGATPGGNSTTPTSSGQFQNLNSYLNANNNSDFGNQFVGKLNNDIGQAGASQQQGLQQFKAASDAGSLYNGSSTQPDNTTWQSPQNTYQDAQYKEPQNVSYAGPGATSGGQGNTQAPYQSTVNNAISDPYGFSKDPNNITAFQNILNAQYKGPQSYSDLSGAYQQASGATQKAENEAKAAQTEPGRFSLLNQFFGNPNYSQGQQSLDNLLIQGNPNTGQQVSQARQNADQSQVDFQNQQQQAQAYASQNMGNTQAARDYARNAIGVDQSGNPTSAGLYQTTLNNAQTTAQNTANTDQQQASDLSRAISSGNLSGLSPEELSMLGVSSGQSYFDVNPNQYLTINPDINQNSVMDPTQASRITALSELAGLSNPFGGAKDVGSLYGTNPVNFNKEGFNQAIQQRQGQYQNAFNELDPILGNQKLQGGAVPGIQGTPYRVSDWAHSMATTPGYGTNNMNGVPVSQYDQDLQNKIAAMEAAYGAKNQFR